MRRNELALLPKLPLLITESADEFDVLKQVLRQPGQWEHHVEGEAQILAQSWFTDEEAKKQVSEILSRFDLDESAIEAEAIRTSTADLEL